MKTKIKQASAKQAALTGHQKGLLQRMLSGDRLVKTDGGRWTLGGTTVRNTTVGSLVAKGAVKLGVGHCTLTASGTKAIQMTLDTAIRIVAAEAPDEYARSYAECAMQAADEGGTRGLKSQVRYMLANMGNWRGGRAKAVREAMRAWLATR